MRRRPTAAAVLAAALLGPVASAPAQDRLVVADPTATDVSAFGTAVVWSRAEGPGRFRLVQRVDGVVRDAPVGTFTHPVDADVGPGPSRGPRAVYARCSSSRRCDVHELDLWTGRERLLVRSDRAVAAPSAWRGRLASIRADRFFAFDRTPEVREPVLGGGGGLHVSPPGRRLAPVRASETDLRADRTAYRTGLASVDWEGTAIVVRGTARRGRTCVVARAEAQGGLGGDDEVVTSPVLDGGFVLWARLTAGGRFSDDSGAVHVERLRLPRSRCPDPRRAEGGRPIVTAPTTFTSIAVAGPALLWTSDKGVHEATVASAFAPAAG